MSMFDLAGQDAWEKKHIAERTRIERYFQLVEQLADAGEMPLNIPWTEPGFQQAVIAKIRDVKAYKLDSDQLATVRRIFRGGR